MSLATCILQATSKTERVATATRPLLKALGIARANGTVRLKLGSASVVLPFRATGGKTAVLRVPQSVRTELSIPRTGRIFVRYEPETRTMRLGPLIGILTSDSSSRPSSLLVRTHLAYGSDKAFCFAFSPRDVDWEKRTVTGSFRTADGGWARRTVPLPDVVYNRMTQRKEEKQEPIKRFKERFIEQGIPIFNWGFFDKWDVYKLLEKEDMERLIPESYLNPSAATLRSMLERYRLVYLKPTGGSLGLGIYRIAWHPRSGYWVRYRRGNRNRLLRFPRFSGLTAMLGLSRGKLRHYIAQQGVRLIEIDGSPVDFRFHMHKNGDNQWVVSGIGCKRAGRGSVTTHLRAGGQILLPEEALRRAFGEQGVRMLESAKQTAVRLAETIERKYRRPLGEIGFDLGIDRKGKIWMFEANAKPGRSIFKHPALKADGRAALRYTFEYCLYLARFRRRKEA